MSDERDAVARFTCEGCGKQYRWKRELAGRRVKCAKCLTIMIAPQRSPIEEHDDDLYDLVPDSPPPRKHEEYEYDAELDFGGTGVAMAPPVIKSSAPPKRGTSAVAPKITAHRAAPTPVQFKAVAPQLPNQKRSRRLKWIAIAAAMLLVASIVIGVYLRMRWLSHPA